MLRILPLAALLLCAAAPPPGSPQAEELAPFGPWIKGLTNPTTGTGCCSLSDCRVVEYRPAANGTDYEAYIDAKTFTSGPDKWIAVPPSVILHRANPTGYAIACWGAWYVETNGFFCFVPNSGV